MWSTALVFDVADKFRSELLNPNNQFLSSLGGLPADWQGKQQNQRCHGNKLHHGFVAVSIRHETYPVDL